MESGCFFRRIRPKRSRTIQIAKDGPPGCQKEASISPRRTSPTLTAAIGASIGGKLSCRRRHSLRFSKLSRERRKFRCHHNAVFPDSEFIRVLMARKTHRDSRKQKVTLEGRIPAAFSGLGCHGYMHSPVFGKLALKTSPSAGARHPGEVYLMALRVEGLRAGFVSLSSRYHRLEMISTNATREKAWRYCARQNFAKNAAALFLMTAVFRRTMWKYHLPRAYRVVLLDAGHLCQTFCLVATWLGLAPFCTAALKDTLIEEDLGIDGIRESVLYVAGVGVPATSARARRQFSRNVDRHATSPSKDGV